MRALVLGTAAVGMAIVLPMAFSAAPLGAPDAGAPPAAPSIGVAPMGAAATVASSPSADPSDDALTAVVRRTCTACHNDQLLTGGLSLQAFDVAQAAASAEAA